MPPTTEQQRIINHNPSHNGRVLAGPGTGKSWTCIKLAGHLLNTHPDLRVKLLTFTRAATRELARKLDPKLLSLIKPSTIHSFALSVLLNNQERSRLPLPLRIADSWEIDQLIRANLARRMRSTGFNRITKRDIGKLEREMAARWESLDPQLVLFSRVDPQVRNAYIGLWDIHRTIYGYTLLSELPFRAGNLIEDFDLDFDDINLLVVDEYQDLNEADIKLVRLLGNQEVKILAIGDDDQSIYSFRMAAPQGILRFHEEFVECDDYQLTLSRRCGRSILEAATSLIETVPNRPRKPQLQHSDNATQGSFIYLRFSNQIEEARGVADLIEARINLGVPLNEIAVLVRSQVDDWADLLLPELQARNINAIDTEWITTLFYDPQIRKKLAMLRLTVDLSDSLAWWTLLRLENGISRDFRDYIYDEALRSNQSFGTTLNILAPQFNNAPTRQSATTTSTLISHVHEQISDLNIENAEFGEFGWAEWVIDFIGREHLGDEVIDVFNHVGETIPTEKGLGYFLGNLEPLAKDFASHSDAVRLMSMTSSKGITVNSCIVMGVEDGIIPHPRGRIEEERRLLYVAMTRATDMCALTFAHRRQGPTARHGSPNVNQPRGRSPLLEALPIGTYRDGRSFLDSQLAYIAQE